MIEFYLAAIATIMQAEIINIKILRSNRVVFFLDGQIFNNDASNNS